MNKWLSAIITLLIFLGINLYFSLAQPDQSYLRVQQFKTLLDSGLKEVQAKYPQSSLSLKDKQHISPAYLPLVEKQIETWNEGLKAPKESRELTLEISIDASHTRLFIRSDSEEFSQTRLNIVWTSILPPLVAVAVALITQQLLIALFSGVLVGSILATHYAIVQGVIEVFSKHMYQVLEDVFKLQILAFVALLLGMVGLMNASGGTRGIIESLQRYTASRRSTKLVTYFMGLLIFFDDYANSFIIGGTMRGVTDKQKISREKLAYIVDSTAAPVSGLAIISTWIGYEVGLFQDVLDNMGVAMGGYQAFLQALPFRFYCILTLMLVFFVIWLRRDFGPMYHAEKRALETGLVIREGATPMTSRTFNSMEIRDTLEPRWYNAVLPIVSVILATVIGLFISGGGVETFNQGGLGSLFSVTTYSDSFSNANSGKVLLIASLIGCIFSVVLLLPQRILSPREIVVAWGKGVSSVFLASMILILAWALNSVSGELGTASFLIAVFKDMVSALWVPILIFLLSGAIAFATGSSWSTMAILIPMAVPLAYEMGGLPLMIIAMGAVLDGSIFGDHCSPLSDTTILSSIACSCDHIDHVKTQMPYALLAMLVATFVCYLPAAMGVIPYALIGAGGIVMVGFLLLVGRDPEAEQTPPPIQPKHFKENPSQRIFAPNESD